MSNPRTQLIVLLVLQAIAVIIYPPAFFQSAPQAAVLPPALFILFVAALVAINSGWLSPIAGRSSLIFVQGVNIVVRLMMLLPNLKDASGAWNWLLFVIQIVGIALSWYTITQIEKLPPNRLLLKAKSEV
ncbi:MAG TPA: hypothetical protein PLJ78_03370 [Anaerolineae bacterium]|nr:hypothetical protein [Anaerolineae bacterium]HQK12968.1 hypothetical protein [Anaerolineae bacterium]